MCPQVSATRPSSVAAPRSVLFFLLISRRLCLPPKEKSLPCTNNNYSDLHLPRPSNPATNSFVHRLIAANYVARGGNIFNRAGQKKGQNFPLIAFLFAGVQSALVTAGFPHPFFFFLFSSTAARALIRRHMRRRS